MKKPHNKQHDARAATLKRIAKGLRAEGKKTGAPFWRSMARVFDDEAKLLRSMR